MDKYSVKLVKEDFEFLDVNPIAKGSRVKKLIIDKEGKKAFFKYEGIDYVVSEACSEKMSYEIAKILGYECAKIELARDIDGNIGVLNYLFVDQKTIEHIDIVSYLNIENKERKEFYTVSNIKKTLDNLDENLFSGFIKLMVFDCLVGEQDRHEENWGVLRINGKYKFSPFYDNGCNLLRNFKDETYAMDYYNGVKNFDSYIIKSKTYIYKEDNKNRYKHFELLDYLNKNYKNLVQKEIINLQKLTNNVIL